MPVYSPERRTALVLCGTGVHGAYHAGVLRALQEAGVKVDIVAGQGVGAGAAALAAVDGASRLWDAGGLWLGSRVHGLYGWPRPLRTAGWLALLLLVVLLLPIAVLATGLLVYPLGFLLEMAGTGVGSPLVAGYSSWLQQAFQGPNLPTIVPRLVMVTVSALVVVLTSGIGWARWRAPRRRVSSGAWWWRLAGAPLDAIAARRLFTDAIEHIVRGVAPVDPARAPSPGRRYADLLGDNLGQPGFRELMLVATDLDARRDVVAALLREPYRREFTAPKPGRERHAEVLDLAGAGREHALDLVSAALTPPLVCDPYLVTFAPDGFWRGETHRMCDRASSVSRLLEEVAAAGASQAIVVSAVTPVGKPHRLSAPRLDLRGRLGEHLAADEAAALRDALEMARLRFDSVYMICPAHNPVGAFDVRGAYDESSDRRQDVRELMDRAYEDAYRQFIEPVVGASGEHLARTASAGHTHERAGLFDDDDSPR